MGKITSALEEKARAISYSLDEVASAPHSMLEQEVALALEHLVRTREQHEEQLRSLLRSECSVDSDLMQLDSYHLRQFRYLFQARDSLKTKVLQIKRERRQLMREHQKTVMESEEKLFRLISQLHGLRS